jgi:hypothetical protein
MPIFDDWEAAWFQNILRPVRWDLVLFEPNHNLKRENKGQPLPPTMSSHATQMILIST